MRSFVIAVVFGVLAFACQKRRAPSVSRDVTFAELRTIKGEPRVQSTGEVARAPYPRERLVDGERVSLDAGALVWLRRDAGATWLVAGPAAFTLREDRMQLSHGRFFVDNELGGAVELETPLGKIELSEARASIELGRDGGLKAYVLRGSARVAGRERVGTGELLTWERGGAMRREPSRAWEDWTGGLATAEPASEPAPFGIGTVGARQPGETGMPRFPLVIQRLDVKVNVDRDFAVTEVDETFVNPSSTIVEGLFSFRTPPFAVLSRFGVDRGGGIVWGRVQEARAALKQYESNVYEGSEEEPALLTWAGAGTYSARFYPIKPGETRRVVTRYTEWLSRQGAHGERRLYVYPMAAEGARSSLPRIEELRFTLDLGNSGALRVRSGLSGKREGNRVVVKAYDFVPRADLAVELFDNGQNAPVAYRAPHRLEREDVVEGADADFATKVASEEPDYIALPLRALGHTEKSPTGVDIGIVVDTSAATEPSALALSRSMAASLLAQLGPDDRAALWAGDAKLRSVSAGSDTLSVVDAEKRRAYLAGLSAIERGGATDLGALLTEAASKLDPKRRSAVIYIGDGVPSVGELAPKSLRERLGRLGPAVRILAAGIGTEPNIALLESLVRGAPAERVTDAYGGARSALRLLEAASKPLWINAQIDFGGGVERVLPRELPPISADDSVLVVGRINGKPPSAITLRGEHGTVSRPITVQSLSDLGDLRRRWGDGRLTELTAEGAGRASLVEVARRFGLVSPFTALYVPTEREQSSPALASATSVQPDGAKRKRWKPWSQGGKAVTTARVLGYEAKEGGSAAEASAPPAPLAQRLEPAKEEVSNAPGSPPTTAAKALTGSAAVPLAKHGRLAGNRASDAFLEDAAPASARRPLAPLSLRRPAADGLGLSGIGDAPRKKTSQEPQPRAVAKPKSAAPPPAEAAQTALGVVRHERRPCGAGADLPLAERRVLWRERLAKAGSVSFALQVYTDALSACEAARWDERTLLLVYIVDNLGSVRDRVELWRALLKLSPAAADAVYRFLLLRVQTAEDLKALHDALGLERIDPSMLEALLRKARTPSERLDLLRGSAERFKDDTELALLVLDAYEDVRDDAGGRAYARSLRRRVDATAHVRTQVGEYYLRLAARETAPVADRDAEEARRTFGELVEFAPEDPLARRRLGDLLRAHGWYEEAARQYETLSALTPDDSSVQLLRALAANGMGHVEEAVRWAEKAASSESEDGGSPLSTAAHAQASTWLAWARHDALAAGRAEEAERLRSRAARFAKRDSSQARVIVSWAHPELRPALWVQSADALAPASDNLPLYGIAQAFLPEPANLEVRLDPEDAASAARLDAKAVVTAILHEGTSDERIVRLEIGFRDADRKPLERVALHFERGELAIVQPKLNREAP